MSLKESIALKNARFVVFQLRFSNFEAVPRHTRYLIREADENRVVYAPSGKMVIEPTKRCSMEHFPFALERAGYDLVDVFGEERQNSGDRTGKSSHFVVRFVFAPRRFARKAEGIFGKMAEDVRQELVALCQDALWRVRAYRNPYFENHEVVTDQEDISINMEMREPFLRPDGKSVTEWQKDAEGNRVGKFPLLLKAQHTAFVMDNAITLV